ncbi:MAG TPA: hypothetical protein DCL21_03620 [Alphaproteobacteria bacterium]|nr:hypothetical protein [Alphaproteobacteria bacterium]
MKIAKNLTYYKGLFFELFGCFVLFMKGYKILKRNYKTSATSQIDILALKYDIIRVVEVKYRKKFDNSINAISPAQAKRLQKSAINIAKKYKKATVVDAMFFSLDKPYISHKKNIF